MNSLLSVDDFNKKEFKALLDRALFSNLAMIILNMIKASLISF